MTCATGSLIRTAEHHIHQALFQEMGLLGWLCCRCGTGWLRLEIGREGDCAGAPGDD